MASGKRGRKGEYGYKGNTFSIQQIQALKYFVLSTNLKILSFPMMCIVESCEVSQSQAAPDTLVFERRSREIRE